jgi:hypothetical protein
MHESRFDIAKKLDKLRLREISEVRAEFFNPKVKDSQNQICKNI